MAEETQTLDEIARDMAAARLTDEQMRARLSQPTKGKHFVLLDGVLYHPVDGGWEAYGED